MLENNKNFKKEVEVEEVIKVELVEKDKNKDKVKVDPSKVIKGSLRKESDISTITLDQNISRRVNADIIRYFRTVEGKGLSKEQLQKEVNTFKLEVTDEVYELFK